MNGVSDLELAVACADASIMPSLLVHYKEDVDDPPDLSLIMDQVQRFVDHTGNANIILAINPNDLIHESFLDMLQNLQISHVTFHPIGTKTRHDCVVNMDQQWCGALARLRTHTKILQRTISINHDKYECDALCVKGNDSGGMTGDVSTRTLFQHYVHCNVSVIPHGGIATPEDVQYYLTHGAVAVGIGTLFAASKESSLSTAAKLKICASTVKDLYIIPDTGQNALLFGETHQVISDKSNWNRRESLYRGIRSGTHGHIYAGHGIDHIKAIEPVSNIVERLMSLYTER